MVKVIVMEVSTLKIEANGKIYIVSIGDQGLFIHCEEGVRVSEASKLNTWLLVK